MQMTRMFNISKLILTLVLMLSVAPLVAAYEGDGPVNFTLKGMHGKDLSLDEFRGKWLVLNYWATWCAPCRKEIPDLSALHSAHDDIVVLGLAFEDTDIETYDEFLEEFQPSYPLLLVDVLAPPEPFGAPRVLPTTIILDPQGVPVKTFLGPVTREDIEWFIDQQCGLINC
jgi:thiol-disulfide isomerase/thioredoxin